MQEEIVRMDCTSDGHVEAHKFHDGYDLWGYDVAGSYNSAYDRAPFQRSPFRPADAS